MLRASSRCASQTVSSGCQPPTAALHDAISAFLLETPCRAVLWQQQPPRPGSVSGGAVLAIVLLALLCTALAGVLSLVTYRTSCFRIPIARG